MNQFDPDPRCPSAEFGDESLPGGAQDLIGATLALMTGYAEHCPAPNAADAGSGPAARNPDVAHLLAAKAAANLAFLAEQPGLSAALRGLADRLRGHWQALEFRGVAAGTAHALAGPGAESPTPTVRCFSTSTARH